MTKTRDMVEDYEEKRLGKIFSQCFFLSGAKGMDIK